jgi:hypothetical protein
VAELIPPDRKYFRQVSYIQLVAQPKQHDLEDDVSRYFRKVDTVPVQPQITDDVDPWPSIGIWHNACEILQFIRLAFDAGFVKKLQGPEIPRGR